MLTYRFLLKPYYFLFSFRSQNGLTLLEITSMGFIDFAPNTNKEVVKSLQVK